MWIHQRSIVERGSQNIPSDFAATTVIARCLFLINILYASCETWNIDLRSCYTRCSFVIDNRSCLARRKFRHLRAGNAVEIAHYVRRGRTPPLYAWPKGVLRGPRGRWFPSRSIMPEPYRHNYTDGVSVTSQTICRRVKAELHAPARNHISSGDFRAFTHRETVRVIPNFPLYLDKAPAIDPDRESRSDLHLERCRFNPHRTSMIAIDEGCYI